MYSTSEDDESAYDEANYDEDYGEARPDARRNGRTPPRVNTARGSTYRPPVPASVAGSPVNQSQFKELTERVNAALRTNAAAITQIDNRTRTIVADQHRVEAGLRKEVADRRKEITGVRRDLQSTREISAVLPILTSLAPGNPLMSLAPLLLLGNDVSASPTDAASTGAAANNGGILGGLGLGGGSGLGLFTLVALSGVLTPVAAKP